MDMIADLPGVRSVRTSVAIIPPSPIQESVPDEPSAPATEPVLGIRFQGGGVILSGTLPSGDAVDAALTQARAVYGFDGVVNQLTVGSVSEPEWLEEFWDRVLDARILGDFTIDVSGGVARLVGTVPTRSMMADVESRLVGALGGRLLLQNRLEVADATVEPGDATSGEACAVDTLEVSHPSDRLFGPRGSTLLPDGMEILGEVVSTLLECVEVDVEVAGHTDSQGSRVDNLALTQAQAQAVVEFLIRGGVDPARLTATGYGEAVPVAPNETEEDRRENRRIEFIPRGGA